MSKFLEALAYFLSNGLDFKLAKELAEKVSGVKAPTGKIEIPEIKKSAGKTGKEGVESLDDVADARLIEQMYRTAGPRSLDEDKMYLAEFIADDAGKVLDDLPASEQKVFIDRAERALIKNVKQYQVIGKTPKKLATKKQRGDLTFLNTKISNPLKSDFVLRGLDGTTENLYNKFRQEQEAIKFGMLKDLNFIKENNIALGAKDKDNLLYNMKIYNELTNKVNNLSDELVEAGKEPEKLYTSYKDNFLNRKRSDNEAFEQRLDEEYIKDQGIMKSLNESLAKMQKQLDEMEDIRSGKAERDRQTLVKRKYQGKGYGPSEGIYRTLARQFLRDEIESGRIETTPAIYNAMKEGGHPFIDAIKIFRHHYGDDKFDVLENYIDQNYPAFGSPGIRYPGRFEFRKLGLVPKNKKAPGKTYAHYSLPDEINAEIEEIDNLILDYQAGKSPFTRTKEELLDAIRTQNSKRAKLVKIKNEILPEDTKALPGDEVLESADVFEFPDDTDFAKGGLVSLT